MLKEFNENNITRRSDLLTNNSISCYLNHGAQQNPHAYPVFYRFLNDIKPQRILEIGTGMGGFTMFLKLSITDLELDTKILTYEINGSHMHNELLENGIDLRLENIFGENYSKVSQDVIDYIQQPGITIVLCDGGNKIKEFKLLSEYIKSGDFIFAHDYSCNHTYFREFVDKKLWNWCEIQDSDINESVIKYNLEPYMKNEFQEAVWVCKIKK